jgi:solute carrier family 35 protein E1
LKLSFTALQSKLVSKYQPTCTFLPRVETPEKSLTSLISSSTSLSASTSAVAVETEKKDLAHTLKIGGFFGLWYALNIGYNIYNKKVLNVIPDLVWSVALLQLVVGLFYVIPIWKFGIRKQPELSATEIKNLIPVAICHLLTHVGAIISLGAGAVSFTHIVKAAEPAGESIDFNLFNIYATFISNFFLCFNNSFCWFICRFLEIFLALAS